MAPWLDALTRLERDGEPSILVTVVAAAGSTPREAGCKMVVTADAQFDTIGGGNLEFQCAAEARALLDRGRTGATPTTRDFPLGPALGQCCGGHVSVLFEPMWPSGPHVALFGAGHVGQALVRLLGEFPVRVSWIDTRPDAFPAEVPPNIRCQVADAPQREVDTLPAGSLVLVMTHDHRIDFDIVAAAMERDDFLGIGLIGSATKRARFVSRLSRRGVEAAAIDRLICPIGLPGIEGKQPATIAISVAAQILQLLGTGQPRTRAAKGPNRAPHATSQATACAACMLENREACG